MTTTLPPPVRPQGEALGDPRSTAAPAPSAIGYLPGLDGLRALAVAIVVVYHANVAWLPGGFLGVEVFFVISGYLITLLLVEERARAGRISLRGFWQRRARRLLPALFVTLAAVVVLTAVFERQAAGEVRGEVAAGLLYVSNWYQIFVGAGYTAAGDFAPLRHLWSLAVEEQFYLVWPVVMALLLWRRVRPALLAAWFVVLAVAIAVAVAVLVPPTAGVDCALDPDAFWVIGERCISKVDTLYLSTPTRAGGLLLGAALALVWRPGRVGRSVGRDQAPLLDALAVLALLVLAAFAWTMHLVTDDGEPGLLLFHGGFLLVGLATVALIAAVVHPGAMAGWALGFPLLRWVGTRSYGIYLYHWVVFQMIRRVAGRGLTPTEFAVGLVITLVIAECSYRWVEMPIRRRGLRATLRASFGTLAPHRRVAVAGAVTLGALVGGATWVVATEPAQPNELEASLDAGNEFVVDPLATVPSTVAPPSTTELPPGTTAAPATTPTSTAPGLGSIGAATVQAGDEPLVVRSPLEPPQTTVPPPPPDTTSPPPPGAIARYALGDSVMLGAAEQLAAAGFAVDAVQSRAFVNGLDRVQQLAAQGLLGDVVVVHLGTNGRIAGDQLAAMMQTLAPVRRVVVLTVRADRSWVAGNNERIRALPGQYPNVVLVDWEQLARSCPGACFYDDGIHLRPDGRRFYADQIVAAV